VHVNLPDINERLSFSLRGALAYTKEKDYFRSTVNVLRRHGFTFSAGCDCTVRSTIPIQAGTSSSSALVVAWVSFLAQMSDQEARLLPDELARYAHEAEVSEFNEAGGMMDHVAAAYGGITAIDFLPLLAVERIPVTLGSFVLGDSREPKDTQKMLGRVKESVLRTVETVSSVDEHFSLHAATGGSLDRWRQRISPEQYRVLAGTVRNHDITRRAREILKQLPRDDRRIGSLLIEHQTVLRDNLMISTPKIDRILDAAMNAGAYGGKINGSGGGGCMFAYAPEKPERVAEAIERAGGKAYSLMVDEGTRNQSGGASS
jgi:galactokinase